MRELSEILADIEAEDKARPGYGEMGYTSIRYVESRHWPELNRSLKATTAFIRPGYDLCNGESSSGRTADFESAYGGPNPSSPTNEYSEKGPFLDS